MTALMLACSEGSFQVVHLLIDNKLNSSDDLQQHSKYGKTALMFVCSEGLSQVVQSLLDNKLVSSDGL